MGRLILTLVLLACAVNAWATAPVIDSTAVNVYSPWSGQFIWTTRETNVLCKLYYDTDSTDDGGVWSNMVAAKAARTEGMQKTVPAIDTTGGRTLDTLRASGDIWASNLTANTTYQYKAVLYITGGGDGDSATQSGSFTTVNDADTVSIAGGTGQDVYIADNAGRHYRLDADRTAAYSGIEVVNNIAGIDLQGHSLWFGDLDSILVPNWSYETAGADSEHADGWFFSDTTVIKRTRGSNLFGWGSLYDQNSPTTYDGDWAIRVNPARMVDSTEIFYIETSADIAIPGGTPPDTFALYWVSVRVCCTPKDNATAANVVAFIQMDADSLGGIWNNNARGNQGFTWNGTSGDAVRPWRYTDGDIGSRGFSMLGCKYRPGAAGLSGTPVKLRIGFYGVGTEYNGVTSLWIDTPRIERCSVFGIVTPANSTTGFDSLYCFPPANKTISSHSGYTANIGNFYIVNGTISMKRNSPWPAFMGGIMTLTNAGAGIDNGNVTMSGLTVAMYGEECVPIYRYREDLDTMTFCTVADSGRGIWCRDDWGRRAVSIGWNSGGNYLAFNRCHTIGHQGMHIEVDYWNPDFYNNMYEYNYITMNSYHANAFGMGQTGTFRYNAFVSGVDENDGGGGGASMQIGGDHVIFHSNYCEAVSGPGYEYALPPYGVQLEGSNCRANTLYNNVFKAIRAVNYWQTVSTAGVKITSVGDSNYFHNNYILGVDSVTTTPQHGYGIRWDNDASVTNQEGTRFYQNHIEGTKANFSIWLDNAVATSNVDCREDTLVESAVSTSNYHTWIIKNSNGNVGQDCAYSGGAAKNDVSIDTDGNLRVTWTIFVQTGNDGDSVWAIDSLGTVYPGGLTASGGYGITLPEFTDDYATDVNFNRYTIYATNGVDSDSSALYEVTARDTIFVLLGGGPPPGKMEINSSTNCSFGARYEEKDCLIPVCLRDVRYDSSRTVLSDPLFR